MTLVVHQLSHRYGDVHALRGVSMEASPGRITAVLGPNAAGKSTLLRCIIGSIKPTSGAVYVDGTATHVLPAHTLAARMAYVPQRSTVSAAFTVREVVELGRYALPANRSRIDEALARMELTELADRPFAALSVGQQQRVTLARALAQLGDGGHLVLDEPMSAMDLRHVRDVITIVRELADRGVTVLIAMHDLSLAAAATDDAWLLNDGQLIAAGGVCDVLSIDRLKAVYEVDFQWMHGRLIAM